MKILSIQEAYSLKFARQKKVKELKYHAGGHCAHLGKLSPGCYSCFVPDPFRYNIFTGEKCNLNCPYCFSKENKKLEKEERIKLMAVMLRNSRLPGYSPRAISFSGGGDPLLYMDLIATYMKFFREIEEDSGKKPWYYLYTNGILADTDKLSRLKDLGFDEIRFHLGASNFSEKVYRNLKKAVGYFKAVTVETPVWPLHKNKLFEMLPKINDLGVKHLNLEEVEVTRWNYDKIARMLPDAVIYPCYEMHLYDDGLVYDIMEEVVKNKYAYSVLDCNCFVKSIQRGPAKHVYHEDIKGLVSEY